MLLLTGFILVLVLIWLCRPPRDSDRRALAIAVLLTAAWLVYAGITYDVPMNINSPRFRWLVVLSLAGAPLVVLFVWSGVTLLTRPQAHSDERGDLP